MIENVARPDAAIENLTNHQQQADMDGTFVKVSRQALDEVLSYLAAMQQAQEPVAWAYDLHTPHHLPEPMPQFVQFNRANMNPKYWTETALYTGPTPPASGKD